MRIIRNDEKGDTIIEVLIAVTILSIVLVSLYSLLNDAFTLSIIARERSQATNLIQEQSEALRAYRDTTEWSQLDDSLPTSGEFHMARSGENWTIVSGADNVNGKYTVSVTDETPGSVPTDDVSGRPLYRNFAVSVTWTRLGGPENSENSTAYAKISRTQFDQFPDGTTTSGGGGTPTPPPPVGIGVCGYYYSDQTDNLGSPPNFNFEGTPIVRLDQQIDYDWSTSAPMAGVSDELFSVRWVGEIEIPQDGDYTFYTRSDDGVRLTIDGNEIIEEWYPHGPQLDDGDIFLSAGRYSLEMELYERTGLAVGELYWESSDAGISYELIPRDALFPDPANTSCDSPGFQFHMIGAGAFEVGSDNRPAKGNEAAAILQSSESSFNMMRMPWGSDYNAQPSPGSLNNRSAHMSWTGDTIAFSQIRIRARGAEYNGWPNMRVYVDGSVVYNRTVNSSTYNVYINNVGNRSAGEHTIIVQFTNDAYGGSSSLDRNLYVDYVELR